MSYYNVIFTILPPLVIGIFDQFVSARMLDRYPQLYQLGQRNHFFTPIQFFYWVGNAFYHSVVSGRAMVCAELSGALCFFEFGLSRRSLGFGWKEFWSLGLGYYVISGRPPDRIGEGCLDLRVRR